MLLFRQSFNLLYLKEPKTDSSKWESVETLETSFLKKEELVRELAKNLFDDMMKSAEEKQKDAGMTASLITKIIDNLQISLKNLHVRVENEDITEPDLSFSMGITLQAIDLYTTDETWGKNFVDRTKEGNKKKAMFKILVIKNFGVYYKTKETSLISQARTDEEKAVVLDSYSHYDSDGRIMKQADDYLVTPLTLDVQLTQNDPQVALEQKKTLMNLYVGLNMFGITVQKGQYDNVQMLLELTSEYIRFLSQESLRTRKDNLLAMNLLLEQNGLQISKKEVKKLYKEIFDMQMDVTLAADPKKPEKLLEALEQNLKQSGKFELYHAIVLGTYSDTLVLWAKEVIAQKANNAKREAVIKNQKKGKGFFARAFGAKEQTEEEKAEQLNQIDKELSERAKAVSAMIGNKEGRKNIPDITFQFALEKVELTLVNDIQQHRGVTLCAEKLSVIFTTFDGTNKYNKRTIDMNIGLQNYGLWVVFKKPDQEIDYSPFLQKLLKIEDGKKLQPSEDEDEKFFDCRDEEQQDKLEPMTHIYFSLGNKEHHESDLPKEEIDETDLELALKMQPIEIIYRAETVFEIVRFFKVKKLKSVTKLAALQQFQKLTNQVEAMTGNLDKDFRNNKVSIRIAAPTLVIPFDKKVHDNSECWVFTMGDVSLDSFLGEGFNVETHEAFELKVERVKFEHTTNYLQWKEKASSRNPQNTQSSNLDSFSPLQIDSESGSALLPRKYTIVTQKPKLKTTRAFKMTKILEDFSSSVLLLKKRSEDEMSTPEMMQALKADKSPSIQIKAQFDDEMKFSLQPQVFHDLVKIGSLFTEGQKPEQYYKSKMLKKLKKSKYHGSVRLVTQYRFQNGTAAILSPRSLYFWPENHAENFQIFDLSGCEQSGGISSGGLNMVLVNSSKKRFEICFQNHIQTQHWMIAMLDMLKELTDMKKEGLGIPADISESSVQLPTETSEEQKAEEPLPSYVQNQGNASFGLKFKVPKISLTLKTPKKTYSKNTASSQASNWVLNTYLNNIDFEMNQRKEGLTILLHVSQLKMTDNSKDERFPFIFQNLPVQGQQDLVTFELKYVEKTSPEFRDCETFINLGFSGLEAYWKPETMINFLEFFIKNKSKVTKQKETDKQLDVALKNEINQEVDVNADQIDDQAGQIVQKYKGCLEKPTYVVKINVNLAYLKAIFIHPDNNTYPIFTINVKQTGVDYWKKCDHDQIILRVQNIQVFDNTNYPETFNPQELYSSDDEIKNSEILGLNRELMDQNMLNFTCILFDFPSETRCEHQCKNELGEPCKDYNILLKMDLQQMKLKFMMEQTLRIVEYSLNWIIKLDRDRIDTDLQEESPQNQREEEKQNESIVEEETKKNFFKQDVESEMSDFESVNVESVDGDAVDWANFDLKQELYCPKLDLNLSCPLIIMPNLSEPNERFELDFGTIKITSNLVQEKNRWVNHPDKIFRSMAVTVQNNNLRFDFKKDNLQKQYQPILKEDTVDVNIIVPNDSPFFEQKTEKGADIRPPVPIDKEGHLFDMNQVDTSVAVLIKQSLLKLHLKQDVIIELFKCLEHNIMKKDKFSEEFSRALMWRKATLKMQSSLSTKRAQKSIKQKKLQEVMVEENFSDDSHEEVQKRQKLKKKTLQITVQASCLSIELRKIDDELIAEFCMVNFELGQQVFADGIQRMYMKAYSFFIFHDEDPITYTKQVMFGHINANNSMVTTDEFYHTLPQKFWKEVSQIAKPKQQLDFELIIDENTKTTSMKIQLSKLKFFLRPQVFNEISEFSIECLKKLDLKKNKELAVQDTEEDDPLNDSFVNPAKGTADDRGNTTKIVFKLFESILVLERREFQKKAAVVQLGVEMNLTQHDQRAIERQIAGQKLRHTGTQKSRYRPIYDIQLKVLQLTPYIINIKDLESTKFSQAKKRVLISAFDVDLLMKSSVSQADTSLQARKTTELLDPNRRMTQKKPVMKFKNKNSLEVKMTPIQAQVSMDDLYVMQQLGNKVREEALVVSKMWQDYQESSIVTESDKQRKIEQDVPPESTIEFSLDQGADIVIINEDKGNFVPMFLFSCESVVFFQNSGLEQQDKSDGNADTKCSLYYFNAHKGYWEPAIERFSISVKLEQRGKITGQTVMLKDPINVNVSVYLGSVINDFLKLWEKSAKRAKVFQKKMAMGHKNALSLSQSVRFRSRDALMKDQDVMLMDTQEALADFVTPYAIRNLTDRPFSVISLKQGSDMQDNVSKIEKGKMKGLAVSYSDTLNMSEQDHNGRKTVVSKDQFVRIKFESRYMKAISKFKLNQNSNFVKHNVFDDCPRDAKLKNPNMNREFYVVQNQLEDQRRVLTVRTQHVLTNKTKTTYKVKQFFVQKTLVDGKVKKEIIIFFMDDLLPGGSMPMPDDRDGDIVEKLKICLRPEGCKKWSDEFKVPALKFKLKCDQNIMWNHYKTYSILRKEKTAMEGVFNYMLLPAMIIKNCLPLPLLISLSQEQKTEEQRKANMRPELIQNHFSNRILDTEGSEETQNKMPLGEYEFQRGEERVFDTISSQAASIDLVLRLNNQNFRGQILRLNQANVATDIEEVIRFKDRYQRTFKIYVRIDTSNAGNKVVIYAKNVLLCHTEQSIEFFYQKKTDIFKDDNANEFPLPIKDNRNKKVSHESTMITDRNEGNEPTIYIHEEHSSMCAALTGFETVKSNLVPINTPGSTGKFSIPCGNMLYMFQCSTATYQPSEKEAVFTRMVEVSPQYIVCNLSKQDIFFCQAHFEMDQTDFLMILRPKDRQPFHWADKEMPQTAKFFVFGAEKTSAHFSLADCGSLAVTNITQDGARHFFRITKRMVLNSNFIIIEDMNNAPYKIDNLCSDLNVSYFQAGAKTTEDIETCPPRQHRPFAWREILDSNFMLNVQFFRTFDQEVLTPVKPQDRKRPQNLEYSLDILNRTYQLRLIDTNMEERTVFVSVYTDQFSKVFEISDSPSVHIFETMKDRKKGQNGEGQIEELKWNESVDMNSSVTLTTLDGDEDGVQEEMSKTRLDIRQINISLINKQVEVLTVVLDRWVSMIGQRQDEWIYEATLSRLQIDNQGQMMPLFPVILKPKCTNVKAPHNHKTMEGVEPTFQLYISIKTNIPNVQYINLFEFLLKELELKIEIEHLMSIFEFAQAFNERFNAGLASSHRIFSDTCLPTENTYDQTSDKHRRGNQSERLIDTEGLRQKTTKRPMKSVRFQAHQNNPLEESKDLLDSTVAMDEFIAEANEDNQDADEQNNQLTTWRSNLITDTMEIVYIEKYKGSPLMIEVSIFKQTRTQEQTKEEKRRGAIVDLLGNLGLQFANITGAPIQLNALEIENVYGTQSVVKGLLSEHYNSNLKTNILKLVGSTDLIGNPTDFVKTLGTGARQFYYAPKEGFMQGPLQGGLGIIKGTGSLVAHTFGGIAGSISKITGTLNRGVLALSMDNQYRQAKEIRDIQQKPKGGFDGMAKGAKGLGSSIWAGIHGIVSQPYKGAKAEGLAGFGKGIGKGLIGTVVKPVSGVVDFVSKTTEGFESAVDGGICYQNDKKMRKPRPFYKEAGVFCEFSKMHARLYSVLRNNTQKYRAFASQVDIFFGAFKLGIANPNEDVKDSNIMMLTNNFLVIVDHQLEVMQVIPNKDMAVPSRATNNPILEGRKLKIFFSTRVQPEELEFMDEQRAKAAFLVFVDMFYTRTDRLTTHLD